MARNRAAPAVLVSEYAPAPPPLARPPRRRAGARAPPPARPSIRAGCRRPSFESFPFISHQHSARTLVVAGPAHSAARQPTLSRLLRHSGRLGLGPHDLGSAASGPYLGVRLRSRIGLPPPRGGAARSARLGFGGGSCCAARAGPFGSSAAELFRRGAVSEPFLRGPCAQPLFCDVWYGQGEQHACNDSEDAGRVRLSGPATRCPPVIRCQKFSFGAEMSAMPACHSVPKIVIRCQTFRVARLSFDETKNSDLPDGRIAPSARSTYDL